MLKRITAVTFLSGMMLFGAPHVAFADGRHGGRDDRRSEHHEHDRGRDRDDYRHHYGYDHDYYDYYGYGCNGYRDGYYYGHDGRPYYYGGRPYYHRNADCDDYYHDYGTYYGSPYCDSYDYRTGYCD